MHFDCFFSRSSAKTDNLRKTIFAILRVSLVSGRKYFLLFTLDLIINWMFHQLITSNLKQGLGIEPRLLFKSFQQLLEVII